MCHFVVEEVFSGAFEAAMRWRGLALADRINGACSCGANPCLWCLLVEGILETDD